MWPGSKTPHHQSQSSGLLLRWTSPDWSTTNHHQNEKVRHGFKEKMLKSLNLASILSNSKYMKRYRELNFEDHELSCFVLTSKQLNLVAYIGFSDLFLAGERIKNMIKMGKIQNSASTYGVVKKPFVTYSKKREGETNAAAVVRTRTLTYRLPYQQVAVVTSVQQSQQQPFTILVQP
ncbi:hypothetical protein KIW84_041107 [Lathyrus oleraceus]|uniref:Uncharacterized protein n=1 Tax=Pisum sativum TaxID=3888 RepID=A0A9D5ANX1_PEA|nr:hypothetical protein KIW84_041107 [Pisum sativum]